MNSRVKASLSISISILIIIFIIVGMAFAFYSITLDNGGINTITTGNIKFVYSEDTAGLTLSNASAVSDIVGKTSNDYFSFSVSSSSTGTVTVGYYIYLTPEQDNTVPSDCIKIYLSKITNKNDLVANENVIMQPILASDLVPFSVSTLSYSASSSNYLIYSSNLIFQNNSDTKTDYYRFRMWLDENYSAGGNTIVDSDGEHTANIGTSGTYAVKINVYGHNGNYVSITNP